MGPDDIDEQFDKELDRLIEANREYAKEHPEIIEIIKANDGEVDVDE